MIVSQQVFFEGRVQGVGFRWSVRHLAKGFEVKGWIRNLVDSRVELQVSGDEAEVRGFLDAIQNSELRSHIRHTTETPLPAPLEATGFTIRHD